MTLNIEDALATALKVAAAAEHLALAEWAKSKLALAAGQSASILPNQRVLGLHAGESYAINADFNAPLDEFAEYL